MAPGAVLAEKLESKAIALLEAREENRSPCSPPQVAGYQMCFLDEE
jgi:hypothetical protein